MGSTSDWETMEHCVATLDQLGIDSEVRALSAHRTPAALQEFVEESDANGVEVFIAAAGGAAHLAGVVAAPRQPGPAPGRGPGLQVDLVQSAHPFPVVAPAVLSRLVQSRFFVDPFR